MHKNSVSDLPDIYLNNAYFKYYMVSGYPHKREILFGCIVRLLEINATSVTPDTEKILKEELDRESKSGKNLATAQLSLMLENLHYGKEMGLPICQDTGTVNIFIEFPPDFAFFKGFVQTIREAVKTATEKLPLRPNTVDPFTGRNEGNNLGYNAPHIYYELNEDIDFLRITVMNKGGGSENMSALFMLNSSSDIDDIINTVVGRISEAGGKPCPPVILGIGIGGDALMSMYLAKKALLRPMFMRNPRKEIADLEERIKREVNRNGAGIMGLGEGITCLDVRIEAGMRHPASFPVGMIVQCYSHRVSSALISKNWEIKYIHGEGGSPNENL